MATISSKGTNKQREKLPGVLEEFRDALEHEINTIKKDGVSSIILKNGVKLQNPGSDYWYKFSIDYKATLPDDTPCKLTIGSDKYEVTVVSCDDEAIILSSKALLPPALGYAQLDNGATVLMERLISCIENNSNTPNPAAERIIPGLKSEKCSPFSRIHDYNSLQFHDGLNRRQIAAIQSSVNNDTTFIWGPPGTGKTHVIGEIVKELFNHQRTTLILSHTNTAVDGAIEKVVQNYNRHNPSNENYPILRLGSCYSSSLPEEVSMDFHVKQIGHELFTRKETLCEEKDDLFSLLDEIARYKHLLKWRYESHFKEIHAVHDNIENNKHLLASISDDYQRAVDGFASFLNTNTDAARYIELKEQQQALLESQEKIINGIKACQDSLKSYKAEATIIGDEIKKHIIYQQQLSLRNSLLSPNSYRKQIAETESQIKALSKELENHKIIKQKSDNVITEYESKGSISKLFSSKANYETAVNIASHSAAAIQDLLEKLNVLKIAKLDYENSLRRILVVEQQLQDIAPSHTKQYWESQKDDLIQRAKELDKKRSLLEKEKQQVEKEISSYKFADNISTPMKEEADHWQTMVEARKSKLDQVTNRLYEATSSFEQLIASEWALFQNCQYGNNVFSDHIDKKYSTLEEFYPVMIQETQNITESILTKNQTEYELKIKEVDNELKSINDRIQELEREAIQNAKIIGTTLTKSYLSDELRSRYFDTVILDEASMASIPALWCACCLSESNIIIVGDFLQLPPIVISTSPEACKWLGTDIFAISGAQKAFKKSTYPKPANCIMLDEQYRMEKQIADIANIYYSKYGSLKSNDNDKSRIANRAAFYQWYHYDHLYTHPIRLIDTSNLDAWATGVPQGKNHSRFNLLSAIVCVNLAFKILEETIEELSTPTDVSLPPSVLIIAPYRPHIEKINELIDIEYRNRGLQDNPGLIKAGTVHSFQGKEADIVIFDLVVDEPHRIANLFLPDDTSTNNDKMFNVAITRAKFKLFIIGNFRFCKEHAKDNHLGQLLDKLIVDYGIAQEDVKLLLPDLVYTQQQDSYIDNLKLGNHITCNQNSFQDYFEYDIKHFKHRMVIYSAFIGEYRLGEVLPAIHDALHGSEEKEIIVVTKCISERKVGEKERYLLYEKKLRAHGVKIVHKKGMHEKTIFVDDSIVWNGSLNSLSYTGRTTEHMERFDDYTHAQTTAKSVNLESIYQVSQSQNEQKCPICNAEMIIKESRNGGIYWSCNNCGFSRKPDQSFPVDGLLVCSKCKGNYKFVMNKRPRWVCENDPSHYQFVRKSDLNLPKMVSIIPDSELKKVKEHLGISSRSSTKQKKNSRHASSHTHTQKNPDQLSLFDQPNTNTASANLGTPSKPIIQMDDKMNTIRVFKSINAASKATGINNKSIRLAATGGQKHAGGYRWRFKE